MTNQIGNCIHGIDSASCPVCLRAEVGRLRAALKPFAELYEKRKPFAELYEKRKPFAELYEKRYTNRKDHPPLVLGVEVNWLKDAAEAFNK